MDLTSILFEDKVNSYLSSSIDRLFDNLSGYNWLDFMISRMKTDINKEQMKGDVSNNVKQIFIEFRELIFKVWRQNKKLVIGLNDLIKNKGNSYKDYIIAEKYIVKASLLWDKVADSFKNFFKLSEANILNQIWNSDLDKEIIHLIKSNDKLKKDYELEKLKDSIFYDIFIKNWKIIAEWKKVKVDFSKLREKIQDYIDNKTTLDKLWVKRKYVFAFYKGPTDIDYDRYKWKILFQDWYKGFPDRMELVKVFTVKTKYNTDDKNEDSLQNSILNFFLEVLEYIYVIDTTSDEDSIYDYVVRQYVTYNIYSELRKRYIQSVNSLIDKFNLYYQDLTELFYYSNNRLLKDSIIINEGLALQNIWIIYFMSVLSKAIQGIELDIESRKILASIKKWISSKKEVRISFNVNGNGNGNGKVLDLRIKNSEKEDHIKINLFNKRKDKWYNIKIDYTWEWNLVVSNKWFNFLLKKWDKIQIWEIEYAIDIDTSFQLLDSYKISLKHINQGGYDIILKVLLYLDMIKNIFNKVNENIQDIKSKIDKKITATVLI